MFGTMVDKFIQQQILENVCNTNLTKLVPYLYYFLGQVLDPGSDTVKGGGHFALEFEARMM